VSSEGGSHPLGSIDCGEEISWTGIIYGKMTIVRGTLSNLRNHCLLWIHNTNSGVNCYRELEKQFYGWEEHLSFVMGFIF
jgi:hypothetical protein